MKIRQFSLINRKGDFFLGQELLVNHTDSSSLDHIYKILALDYPRFFKMDPLAKLGFLLTEKLMAYGQEDPYQTGITAWNEHSSYHADIKHLNNIATHYPGPGNFVYTLPNIALGEMAIRNKIFGETAFFISPKFDPEIIIQTLETSFLFNGHQRILAGWIEAGPSGTAGFFMDVIPSGIHPAIQTQDLQNLYTSLAPTP